MPVEKYTQLKERDRHNIWSHNEKRGISIMMTGMIAVKEIKVNREKLCAGWAKIRMR